MKNDTTFFSSVFNFFFGIFKFTFKVLVFVGSGGIAFWGMSHNPIAFVIAGGICFLVGVSFLGGDKK